MSIDSITLSKIKNVMDSHGIPEGVWYPIMKTENPNFDPAATAINTKEYSVGLFQINHLVHPELGTVDQLKDPVYNANIAAKYFISPAMQRYSNITDPEQKAELVYKNGILPLWTPTTQQNFKNNFYDYRMGQGIDSITNQSSQTDPAVTGINSTTLPQGILKILFIVGLIIVGFVALFSLLKWNPTNYIPQVKAAKNIINKGRR